MTPSYEPHNDSVYILQLNQRRLPSQLSNGSKPVISLVTFSAEAICPCSRLYSLLETVGNIFKV
jgi:hypothetical protein